MEFAFGALVGGAAAWLATRWAAVRGWYLSENNGAQPGRPAAWIRLSTKEGSVGLSGTL